MNVGISILTKDDANIWSSGIIQNLLFLCMTLDATPEIDQVFLINGGDSNKLPIGWPEEIHFPLVRPEQVTYDIDIVIIMGATLPDSWLLHIMALGKTIILFDVGHTYASLMESAIFQHPGSGVYSGPLNRSWILSCHERTSRPLLEIMTRRPVQIAPHIWSPIVLQYSLQFLGNKAIDFGFSRRQALGRRPWRVATFEPNQSVVKSAFIPMLIIDAAYRTNQESVGLMAAFNTFHLKEHLTFNRLASHLDVTLDHKATYEPRIAFGEACINYGVDAIVSHQVENDQNYLYYDALYGNYPLVHNSLFLHQHNVGFYYPDFSAYSGANALLYAHKHSDDENFWNDYKRHNVELLRKVDPLSKDNIHAFAVILGIRDAEDN